MSAAIVEPPREEGEIWREVVGWECLYLVSNHGRVWSIGSERIMKGSPDRDGYLQVGLCMFGVRQKKIISRLVAEAFIENPDWKREVDHIDGTRTNNYVSNLRWSSRTENSRNRKAFGSSGLKGASFDKKANRWRADITLAGKTKYLGYFDTAEEAHAAYCGAAVIHFGEFARFS